MKRSLPPLLIGILLLVPACDLSHEQIERTMNIRERALRSKDLSLYLSCISTDYKDRGEDFRGLKSRLESYFSHFERIEYRSFDRSIELNGANAVVIQSFYIEVEKEGKKSRFSGKESIRLRKESGGWKITGGLGAGE